MKKTKKGNKTKVYFKELVAVLHTGKQSVTAPMKSYPSPFHLLLAIMVSIFTSDVIIMVLLSLLPRLSVPLEVFLDALLLTFLVFPALYLLLFRPMALHATERKQKEEEIRVEKEYFETIMDSSPDLIFTVKKDGTIGFANKALKDILEYEFEDIEGRNFIEFIAEEMHPFMLEKWAEIQKGIGSFYETKVIKKGGFISDCLVSHSKLKGLEEYICILKDITEYRRTEKGLAQAVQQWRDTFDAIEDLVMIINKDYRVVQANQAMYKTFDGARVLGAHCYELIHGTEEPLPNCPSCQTFRDHKAKHAEICEQHLDGHWFDIASYPIKDKDGIVQQLVHIFRDITGHIQMQEEKEEIKTQLFQAQKLEAIGILAGGIAHDFNNLLTTIQGYTELSMMKIDESDLLYRNLKQIRHASTRAANLTQQLLLFSRKQPMELTPLNINKTVENLLKMFSRIIGEDIVINTNLEPDLWTVRADEGNIEQVIMNLGVNARDAMRDGGKLTIKTENIILDEDNCKVISDAHPGKFVCLSVTDMGTGMDKETIQHIFEPFFSTKEPGKGTGLGLSVVYGIVQKHEGWINVYSKAGQGSTFKVYLPAFSRKLEDEPKETILLQELQGSGERILLVEDEKGIREVAARMLGENGYFVFTATNAKEALDIFEREKGKFQLVFSDVVLPDKSGLKLVDELLSRKPELRVLLSSGYTDDKSQWPSIRERGFPFLQKPHPLADLLRTIREVIGPS